MSDTNTKLANKNWSQECEDALNRQIYTDNIKIDLLTKDIKIYMNSDKHKVEVLSN